MNYKTVLKMKKKNTALLVVALVLSLVLVGGAIAGIGYAFDWWNFGQEEVKELPRSTYNVEATCIDDVLGVAITEEDFAFYMDEQSMYETALKDWEAGDMLEANKPVKPDYNFFYGNVLLNVEGFGADFEQPESGLYNITVKLNGEEFEYEEIPYNAESDSAYLMFTSDFKGKLIEADIMEREEEGFVIAVCGNALLGETAGIDDGAVALMVGFYNVDDDFESIEIVSFERVDDLSESAE